MALQPVVLDRHPPAFDAAGFAEALAERGQIGREDIGRPAAIDESDHRHRPLLRARRERPCSRQSRRATKRARRRQPDLRLAGHPGGGPIINELAIPGFDGTGWFTVATATGVPAPVVASLNRDIDEMLHAPGL